MFRATFLLAAILLLQSITSQPAMANKKQYVTAIPVSASDPGVVQVLKKHGGKLTSAAAVEIENLQVAGKVKAVTGTVCAEAYVPASGGKFQKDGNGEFCLRVKGRHAFITPPGALKQGNSMCMRHLKGGRGCRIWDSRANSGSYATNKRTAPFIVVLVGTPTS